jgi:hypothetical protein
VYQAGIDALARPAASRAMAWRKQGERLMPVGMFRSEEGWVQVDYGTGNIPITRSKYEENKYKPDFDKLPSEAEYWAAEKKKEDDAKGP